MTLFDSRYDELHAAVVAYLAAMGQLAEADAGTRLEAELVLDGALHDLHHAAGMRCPSCTPDVEDTRPL